MAKITDIPTAVTGAGQPFDYTNPPTLASVALVNAPLDPDHLNIGLNRAAYDAYIDSEIAAGRAYTATGINLQNPAHPLVLPIPFESSAYFYNYGRVNIGGVNWYIFYDAEYMNKTATRFIADIDEAASYNWQLGYSPIERGHVAVAAAQSDPYGDLYMTAPEPIEAPPVTAAVSEAILPASDAPTSWRVVVVSANDLRGTGATPYFQHHIAEGDIANAAGFASDATKNSAGTVQVTVQESPYPWRVGTGGTMQVFVPLVTASPVSTIDGVGVGGGVYIFSLTGYAAYMSVMQGAPWVIDGISEVNIVPDWSVGGVGGGGSHAGSGTPPTDPTSGNWTAAAAMPTFVSELTTQTTTAGTLGGWRGTVANALGLGVYRKALTAQFSRIIISDGESEQEFFPEVWRTSGIGFTLVTESTHGTPVTRAIPIGYTALGDQRSVTMGRGGTPARAVSGYGTAYSNTAQQDVGPLLAATSSFSSRQVLIDQKALALFLALSNARLNVGIQGVQTILGTAAAGATLGGLPGAAGASIGGAASVVSSAIQASASLDILDISKSGSFDIAAYQLGVSGTLNWYSFRAWAQSQLSVSGRGNMHTLDGAWRAIIGRGLTVLITTPTADALGRALSMWRRYGYMVGRSFKPSRLDVMSQMSYWKTNGAVITGALPQRNRQTMAQAFDRGITVWSSIAAIGTDVTNTNTPTAGISY